MSEVALITIRARTHTPNPSSGGIGSRCVHRKKSNGIQKMWPSPINRENPVVAVVRIMRAMLAMMAASGKVQPIFLTAKNVLLCNL
jgi:hypothetical protein